MTSSTSTPSSSPSSSDVPTSSSPTEGSDDVSPETTIVISGPAEAQDFTLEKAREWAAENPKSDGSIWQFSYSLINEETIDAFAPVADWWSADNSPDIYMFANDKTQPLASANAIAPVTTANLTTMEDEYNIEDGYLESVTFAKTVYGYPYTLNGYTYYYNGELVDSYKANYEDALPDYMRDEGGVKEEYSNEADWTMNDWLEVADMNDVTIYYPLNTAYYVAAALCSYGASWEVSYNEAGAVEEIKSNFDSDEGYAAAYNLYDWYNNYGNALDVTTQEAPSNDNGTVLGCVNGAWAIASSDGGTSSYANEEVRHCLIPAMEYTGEAEIDIDNDVAATKAFTGSKAFGVNPNKSSGNTERLSDLHSLALYLVSPEVQQDRFDYNNSWFPTTQLVDGGDEAQDLLTVLTEQLNDGVIQANLPGTIWTAPVTLMEGIMQGTYSTPDSLWTALEQLDNSLQQIR